MPRTMKAGDTWPPLYGSASDATGLIDLSGAAALEVVLASKTHVVNGAAVSIHPPVADPDDPSILRNWKFDYTTEPGCTNTPGEYTVELKVIWETSPLKLETFPNTGSETLTLEAS